MEKKFPVPAPVLVVDANKDISDMTELFRVISDKWSIREGDQGDLPKDEWHKPQGNLQWLYLQPNEDQVQWPHEWHKHQEWGAHMHHPQ